MRAALLLLVFISLVCLLTQGGAKTKDEDNKQIQEFDDDVMMETRVKRNAQPIAKKKRKKGKPKNKKRNKKDGKSNKKRNAKKSNNQKIKKNKKKSGGAKTTDEDNKQIQEFVDDVMMETRVKRNAQPFAKKKRKKGKPKNKKRNKKERKSNKKKNAKKSNNQKIKKNRKKSGKQKIMKNRNKTSKQKNKKNRNNKKGKQNRKKNKSKINKNKKNERKTKPSIRAACSDETITKAKTLSIKWMDNRMRQARRAPKQHKVIGNKCKNANVYTTAAKRFSDAVNRAGGKENCKTDPTETIANLTKCQEEICTICISPLNSTWQELYPTCDSTSKDIKAEVEAAQTCDDITAANAKAKKKNSECAGPFASVTDVKDACKAKNKACKTMMETARDIEVDCIAVVSTNINDTNAVDEAQDNRTSIVEASLDTFINGTGDLLNSLGLSSGEGSDGTLSDDAMAAADNITRSDTISANPTCEGLLSYSANLIDFSKSTEGKDSLSEEQTSGAATQLGTINNLVSTGAAGTALAGCNTRQSKFSVAIFRWIIWRCYYFFWNWLRKSRCRRLQRLCVKLGEPWCSKYCKKCELPELTGGVWWLEPVFTYEWYPVDPCLDRTKCIFNCPQCPAETTMTTSGAITTGQGRRAKVFEALIRKSKTKTKK